MASRNRVNGGRGERAVAAKAKAASAAARPRLGQHFLADPSAAARIVDALGDVSQATVVEIGPGKGILTDLLAVKAGHLIAIELDRVLAAQLRMKYSTRDNVEIIEGNILTIDLGTVLGPGPGALAGLTPVRTKATRVIGNLPYYITSDILLRLFSFHRQFDSMVIMVQREVGERIAAKPGGSEYGLLSATAQLYAKVEKLFLVPAGAFAPAPKVQSAALRLVVAPQFERLRVEERQFIEFLRLSFAQKRKTLVNNLKERYEPAALKAAMTKAGIRPDARAETLPLEKAGSLFRQLAGKELS
jgi:16S rRNA (adenine1518-N6/adenine1519-N6)-dimethyltransferase